MASDPPKWLNASYVQNILQKTENDQSIKVSDITVKPATLRGENMLSDIYRVTVEMSRVPDSQEVQDKQSLIIKLIPIDDFREKLITSYGFFDTEISMMSTTLPKMNQILTGIGTSPLSAQCLFVQQEKPVHLILEDLAIRGFQKSDRQVGLDLDHCLLAIRNLANFHASSVALKEKDPLAVTKYVKGIFIKEKSVELGAMVKACVKSLAKETSTWPELSPRISEKLHKLSEVAFEKACEVSQYREDEFNVLIHGDFNINNMLFIHDEIGKPVEHIFVDFQLSCYTSPVTDIMYFLATTPSDNVRINHRETVLREYYESLTSVMAKLKCSTHVPSFDDLQEIMEKRSVYEAIVSFVLVPGILVDSSDYKDLGESIADEEIGSDNPAYGQSAYRKLMTRLLPLWDSKGLLDD